MLTSEDSPVSVIQKKFENHYNGGENIFSNAVDLKLTHAIPPKNNHKYGLVYTSASLLVDTGDFLLS